MPSEVILPRVDMDMATGKISKWYVEAGAKVAKGQPLFEIETDKAAMEIEAQASGTIRDLAAASGEDIPVGSVVAWIDAEGETATARPAASPNGHAAAPPAAVPSPAPPGPPRGLDIAAPPVAEVAGTRPRATPLARRLARERGLDIESLQGTGPRGRVQAIDIEAMGPRAAAAPASPGSPHAAEPSALVPARAAATASAGGPLNLTRLREGQGTPLFLVHGFGAEAASWRPFLSGQELGQPVFAVDLPGHGASPLEGPPRFSGLVDALEAALGGAGLPAVHLLAHSLGAAVAVALTARGVLDIRSLVLLSPAGLGPEINGDFLRGYLGARSEASLTPWMQELVADPALITPAFVRATLKGRDGTTVLDSQRRLVDAVFPDGTQAASVRADLGRVTVPTRVVFGTADRILPWRHALGLPGTIALHLLAGIGHMPHLEARDVVATIVRQSCRP